MTYFVAVTDSPTDDDLSIERVVLRGCTIERVPIGGADSGRLADADAIMCMHARVGEDVLRTLRRCRAIVRFGTGLDNIDLAAAKARGISVAGVHDYCTREVADHTIALLLAWNRKILAGQRFIQSKDWNKRRQTTGNWGCAPIARLAGQTLGLIGFGRIGQAVAQRARAFEIKVIASSRHRDNAAAAEFGVELTTCDDLLSRSDYVSLHVPLTTETESLVNARVLQLMKPSAVLINTSRGALVDEEALAEALAGQQIAGALLDVYKESPLPTDHAFRQLDNVILTPHIGFYSEESLLELRRMAAETVLAHLS